MGLYSFRPFSGTFLLSAPCGNALFIFFNGLKAAARIARLCNSFTGELLLKKIPLGFLDQTNWFKPLSYHQPLLYYVRLKEFCIPRNLWQRTPWLSKILHGDLNFYSYILIPLQQLERCLLKFVMFKRQWKQRLGQTQL